MSESVTDDQIEILSSQCDATRSEQFCDYIVLDSVNMASMDKDSILDQLYTKSNMFAVLPRGL